MSWCPEASWQSVPFPDALVRNCPKTAGKASRNLNRSDHRRPRRIEEAEQGARYPVGCRSLSSRGPPVGAQRGSLLTLSQNTGHILSELGATRGLEAAYLAGGQARQAKETLDSIKAYEMVAAGIAGVEPSTELRRRKLADLLQTVRQRQSCSSPN